MALSFSSTVQALTYTKVADYLRKDSAIILIVNYLCPLGCAKPDPEYQGVENTQQLMGAGNQGHFLGLTRV